MPAGWTATEKLISILMGKANNLLLLSCYQY